MDVLLQQIAESYLLVHASLSQLPRSWAIMIVSVCLAGKTEDYHEDYYSCAVYCSGRTRTSKQLGHFQVTKSLSEHVSEA